MFRQTRVAVVVLGLSLGLNLGLNLGAGLSQARAAEPPVFQAYKTLCFDTRADPQKALAALGPGWSDAPLAQLDPGSQQVHKVKTVGTEHWELVLIEHVFPKGADQSPFAKRMRTCMLSTSSRTSGLEASVTTLMGAPPNGRPNGGVAWSFADEATGRRYTTGATKAEANAALARAPMVFVIVTETTQGDGAGFVELSKVGA